VADLSTLTSRRRLPRDGTKRWTRLANGRGLGYRRSRAAAGTWYVRLHVGGSAYRMLSLGTADDEAPADGSDVLSYRQALDQAIQWEPEEVAVAERKRKALTVRAGRYPAASRRFEPCTLNPQPASQLLAHANMAI
jgi:hypothetical protein